MGRFPNFICDKSDKDLAEQIQDYFDLFLYLPLAPPIALFVYIYIYDFLSLSPSSNVFELPVYIWWRRPYCFTQQETPIVCLTRFFLLPPLSLHIVPRLSFE